MANIGDGVGSDYPTDLDTQDTLEINYPSPSATRADAEWANDVVDAILAIQAELGAIGAQNFIRVDGTAPVDFINMEVLALAPSAPIDGTLAIADGAGWDPGSGKGLYRYDGAAWNFCG